MTSLLWAAFCLGMTALLLYVVIRLALRRLPPLDDPGMDSLTSPDDARRELERLRKAGL